MAFQIKFYSITLSGLIKIKSNKISIPLYEGGLESIRNDPQRVAFF
jgi:hypothetical protein